MQNTSSNEGMPQSVRSLNRSDTYLRPLLYVNANLYGTHGQLHPALARRRQAPTTESGRRPAHRLLSSYGAYQPRSSRKPAKQAASPRWVGHKLRFAFRWYSALLKHCRPRGQSARRTQRLPHGAFLCPKIGGRKSPKERFVQRKLHKTTPVSRKSGLEPERKPELGTSISICCRIGQPGAETCR